MEAGKGWQINTELYGGRTNGSHHLGISFTSGYADTYSVSMSQVVLNSSGDENMDITLGRIYFYLTAIMSILSMMGSVVIVLTYWRFTELRTRGRQLLVFLSLAEFVTAFGNFLGIMWYTRRDSLSDMSSHILCDFHAALTFFSSVSSFLWTVAMAVHLYVSIVRMDAPMADRMVPVFHVVCWVLPGEYVW